MLLMVHRATGLARRLGIPEWTVVVAMVTMAVLLVQYALRAQVLPTTQDGINAILFERSADFSRRLDHLEAMVQSVVVGVFLQLVAVLLWMAKNWKSRGD